MAVDTTSVPVPHPHQPCCWFMESYLYLADWLVPGHLAPAVGSRGSTHGTMKTVAGNPHLTYSFYLNVPAHTTRTSLQHPSLTITITITIIITSTSTSEETTPRLVCLHLPPPPRWEWVVRGKFQTSSKFRETKENGRQSTISRRVLPSLKWPHPLLRLGLIVLVLSLACLDWLAI